MAFSGAASRKKLDGLLRCRVRPHHDLRCGGSPAAGFVGISQQRENIFWLDHLSQGLPDRPGVVR
jgi:hypothetical protein